MLLYCSGMIYNYYSCLGFLPIKHNREGKYIHNEIFNNILHFIKNIVRVNFLEDGFFVYYYKVIICKIGFIPPTPYYMIPMDWCQTNKPIINFFAGDMTSKLNFSKNKMDALYPTERMQICLLHMLDE